MKKALSLALVCLMALVQVGCLSELQNVCRAASDVLTAASQIISPDNPTLGAKLDLASKGFADLDKYVGQYDKATADGKAGIAQKVEAVSGILAANLQDILRDGQIKNKDLVEYVTKAVAIGNVALKEVLDHLPQAGIQPQEAVVAKTRDLPKAQGTTAKQLRQEWNDAVKKSFPKAKI